MSETLFKVTKPDGSPWNGDMVYEAGRTYRRRRTGTPKLCSERVLHAARTPEQAARHGWWPYVLWEVEGVVAADDGDKVGCRQLTVVRRLPTHLCFGPNGAAVLAVVERAGRLTADEPRQLAVAASAAGWAAGARAAAARAAGWAAGARAASARAAGWAAGARAAAWAAAGPAAGAAIGDAVRLAARAAAWDAAWGCVVADLVGQHGLEQHHIDTLRNPWVDAIGPTWEETA